MSFDRLRALTDADRATLHALGSTRQLDAGDVLVAAGTCADALYFVEQGFLSVQEDGITATRLGPGEIAGEMSMVQRVPSSVTLRAELSVTLWEIPFQRLDPVLQQQPQLAARLYASLAHGLSERLRAQTRRHLDLRHRMARSDAHFRIGQITERHLLPPFVAQVDRLRAQLDELVSQAVARPGADDTLADDFAATCDQVVALLDTFTSHEWLLRMGHADPMSFRDTDDLRVGVGAVVFREFFSIFMSSMTMARYYAKPRGYADDFLTVQAIDQGLPEGDGERGLLVDRWFLQRPICRVRRSARRALTDAVLADLSARPPGALLCSLAAGAGLELLDILEDPAGATVRAICVDLDEGALAALRQAAQRVRADADVGFICCDILYIWEEGPGAHIEPQDLIYAVDLCEGLDDVGLEELIDDIHHLLAPGGRGWLTQLAAGHPDALLMEHVLEWTPHMRDRPQIEAILQRGAFADGFEISPLEEGLGWLIRLDR